MTHPLPVATCTYMSSIISKYKYTVTPCKWHITGTCSIDKAKIQYFDHTMPFYLCPLRYLKRPPGRRHNWYMYKKGWYYGMIKKIEF